MVTQELEAYIQNQLQQGQSKEAIVQSLLQNNWDQQDIDESFLHLQTNNPNPLSEIPDALHSRGTTRSDLISNIVLKSSQTNSYSSLFTLIPLIIIVTSVLIYYVTKGLPWWIALIFISFMVLIAFLRVDLVKRVNSINLYAQTGVKSNIGIAVDQNETVQVTAAGIQHSEGIIQGVSFLGKGKDFHPENALLVTQTHIHAIVVPLAGAGQIINQTDINMTNLIFARKDIQNKLQEMLNSQSLLQILQSNPANYSISLTTVTAVSASGWQQKITFKLQDRKKYTYFIRDKSDFSNLKTYFHIV